MEKQRVLIIEDDSSLVRGLKDAFVMKGFEVLVEMDGRSGLDTAIKTEPDIIILDLMLPKLSGFEVCQAYRETERETPIIMLTAKGSEEDVVKGLNLGADDYVTKPFGLKELLARVNVFVRKSKKTPVIEFGSYRLDTQAKALIRVTPDRVAPDRVSPDRVSPDQNKSDDVALVALTPKEYGVLSLFLKREGHALTRDTILNVVWGSNVLTTARSVDRCITTLRKKIEQDTSNPKFIKSIRDIGYRFDSKNS